MMKSLNPQTVVRKAFLLSLLVLSTTISCTKDEELPREKFLGIWTATNTTTKLKVTMSVTEGKDDKILIWNINGQRFELEVLNQRDSSAHQTNFSVPFFADNSASLRIITKDSMYGIRTIGSIFLPNYKSDHYTITR